MGKKFGLGKGLSALIPEDMEQDKDNDNRILIPINNIKYDSNQPRKNFDYEKIAELAESIKTHGIIQPLILRKDKDENYIIVAGERRWRAAKMAGLKELPSIIMELSEKDVLEISLIENIQREDLNPIEKARSFRQLMDEYGMTQMELSETIGISRSALANTVRLLNLDSRVMELVIQGQLTEGHARSLLCFEDPDKQYKAALEIIEKGQNVRDIENKVKNKKNAQKRDPKYDAIIQDIEGTFQGYFGTKVRLEAGKRSGKIIIQYSSNEDLERIMDLIKNN